MATKINLTLLTAFSFCLLASANMSIASYDSDNEPTEAVYSIPITRVITRVCCNCRKSFVHSKEDRECPIKFVLDGEEEIDKSPFPTIEPSNETVCRPDCNREQLQALNEFHRAEPTNN